MYQGRLLHTAVNTVLKTVGWETIRGRHLSLPPDVGGSLEVKAPPCEGGEASALLVHHPNKIA